MHASHQPEFQFLEVASGERNNLLEVQEVQVGLVVLVAQALPTEMFFLKKVLKSLYEKLHITHVGHLCRTDTTTFLMGPEEPVQRLAGFLLNPSAT